MTEEERFRTAFEQAAVGIALYSPEGHFLHVNARLSEIIGRPPQELIGQPFTVVTHPDDVEAHRDGVRRVLAGHAPFFTLEKRYVRPDGGTVWVNLTITVVRSAAGAPQQLIGFLEDVSERKKLREELAQRNLQLQEAHRRKDEFLATLAHELRNLLGPVKNAVHLLQMRGTSDPVLVLAGGVADRQVNHMVRLIDDLLDLSRIGQGKVLLRKDRCDLAQIVRQTAEDYRSVLELTGLKLSITAPTEPVWVMGDPTRLSQIVGNLLHNANKFTDPGGEVCLRVEVDRADPAREKGTAWGVVTVRDNGVGMVAETLARVFEFFAQDEGQRDRNHSGLGLGLALVKGLVELHEGRIDAGSEGPGKGTTFTIRLPLDDEPSLPHPNTSGSAPAEVP